MVADASQLLRQIRHFMSFMKNVLFHLLCSPHFSLLISLFSPQQKCSLAMWPNILFPCCWPSPDMTSSTGAGYVSFLKAEREHDVGGTELESSQGTRGVYYKSHILSKQNGNRQTDICCLDFYHLQAVHTMSRTLNQVWDNMKEGAKAGQLSKSKSFKKVQKKVIGSQKNEASTQYKIKQPTSTERGNPFS